MSALSMMPMLHNEQRLNLTISIRLEDLLLASPIISDIDQTAVGSALSPQLQDQLESYLNAHLTLKQSNTTLSATLISASIQSAANEHVGTYKLLLCHFALPRSTTGQFFPLTLFYDAVMHEIRNHRVIVFWESSTNDKSVLAEFGFKRLNGEPKP